jgi:peptide/nickel transport system substrate-binding protein
MMLRRTFGKAVMGAALLGQSALTCVAWAAGGALRVAVSSNINTLDPAKSKIGEEYIAGFLIFSGLTEIAGNGKLQPDLAESWSHSDDLKTWTFHLRKGVKWHHGREFDAQDVLATIKRILDPATGSVTRVNFQLIDKMDAPDDHTTRFELKIPYAGFADLFSDRQARIVPRDKLDTLATSPIGTGPFKFKLFNPGDRIELVRNPDYYVSGTPKLDSVTLRIIPESAAQVSSLESGDVDLVWNLPLESIPQFKNSSTVTVDSVPTSTWDGIIMNCSLAPFTDTRVRRAVLLATDKAALVEFALNGYGTATHTMIPPGHPFYNNDIKIGPPDLDQARKLLADAGHPDGFDITIHVPTGRPTRERAGTAVREMLKPIGIKVDVQRIPWDKFITDIEGKAVFFVDGFYSRPTIDSSTYPFFHSTGSWNTTLWHYKNAEMDKVLDGARATGDPAEQARLYKQMQAIALQDPPGVSPYVINHVNAYRNNVKNFHSSPMMWLDLREVTVG